MALIKLTPDQARSILESDSVGPFLVDFIGQYSPKTLDNLQQDDLIRYAEYVFARACTELHTIETPNGEAVVGQLGNIYGIWSDTTDWLLPFETERDAVDFINENFVSKMPAGT